VSEVVSDRSHPGVCHADEQKLDGVDGDRNASEVGAPLGGHRVRVAAHDGHLGVVTVARRVHNLLPPPTQAAVVRYFAAHLQHDAYGTVSGLWRQRAGMA